MFAMADPVFLRLKGRLQPISDQILPKDPHKNAEKFVCPLRPSLGFLLRAYPRQAKEKKILNKRQTSKNFFTPASSFTPCQCTLRDLLLISDYDPRVQEKQEIQRPSSLAVSYVLR